MFKNIAKIFPGFVLTLFIAFPAWLLGKKFTLVGGPVFGILLGMLLAFWKRPPSLNEGIRFTSKKILQTAIILLGFEMHLYSIYKVGGQSLLVMLFTLTAAFITAWYAGKKLNLQGNTSTLIGVGTAICGGSAIAATAPIINADDKEVAYSISTIFLFNIIAVFIFPAFGHVLGMNDIGFGMWAGTAINDTSSVVAAGYAYSDAAGNFATIVKLTRTLMIVPITLVISFYISRKSAKEANFNIRKVFPWFILGFVTASIVNTFAFLSHLTTLLAQTGKFFIVMAMSAIGLNTNIKQLLKNGNKPILLGLACWFAVAITSLLIQHLMHIW